MKIILSQSLASKRIFVDDNIVGYIVKKDDVYVACLFQEGPKKLGLNARKVLVYKDGDIIIKQESERKLKKDIKEFFKGK